MDGSPLDALEIVIEVQQGAIAALEESEATLSEVRNVLNETIRDKANLSEKDLLLVLIKAQSGLVAGLICSNQSQIANAKQSLIAQKEMIRKMKEGLGGMFGDDFKPPWGDDGDK